MRSTIGEEICYSVLTKFDEVQQNKKRSQDILMTAVIIMQQSLQGTIHHPNLKFLLHRRKSERDCDLPGM